MNIAKKAIDIFKNHFASGLATANLSFPLHLWCRLVPLATITLNLLRPARINPRLSAHKFLNRVFNYNKTPLAPPGTKVLVHDAPSNRKTWAPHGSDGWCIGIAPDHYRCHRLYISSTRAERISSSVKFLPHKIPVLCNSTIGEAVLIANKLVDTLSSPEA